MSRYTLDANGEDSKRAIQWLPAPDGYASVPYDHIYRKQNLLRCEPRGYHVQKREAPCERYKPLGTALMGHVLDDE